MRKALRKVWFDDGGQDMAEYAVMLVVLVVVVVATVTAIGTSANIIFSKLANMLGSV